MNIILHVFDNYVKANRAFRDVLMNTKIDEFSPIFRHSDLSITWGNEKHIYTTVRKERLLGMKIHQIVLDDDSMFSGKEVIFLWGLIR